MISRDNFIDTTMKKCASLAIGQALDIRSYKRNRKVVIEKIDTGYHVYEDGFEQKEFLDLTEEKLQKLLRTIEKREFPRSNKLRFYILDDKEASVSRANYMIDGEEDDEEEEDTSFLVRINCDYSNYQIVRNTITQGDGVIEHADFTNSVYLKVRLEEPLFNILNEMFFVRMHKL